MTDQEKIKSKNKLKLYCHTVIKQRIEAAKTAIENAQLAANNEEKSSAGDKYETGRAMGHLEKDMHSRQMRENIQELAALHSINTDIVYTAATSGAFIQCVNMSFFIIAGLGKQVIEGEKVLFLSPHAPLAKVLRSKEAGDRFIFNSIQIDIVDVY